MPVLSAPHTPAPLPTGLTDWSGLDVSWEGWDGTVWTLSSPDSGVVLTKGGLRGVGMPTVLRYSSKSPAVAGSRWRGSLADEREVFWPLLVYSDAGNQSWLDYDSAFWRTLDPTRLGRWVVTQPSGVSRWLWLRFADDGDGSFESDPSSVGWSTYGVSLVAEQPYWEGPSVSRIWNNATSRPFFGGVVGGKATPFFISNAATLGTATLSNPGDVSAYPVWTINGPSSSATLGLGSRTIQVNIPVAAGASLTIDTRPSAQTAIDSTGADVTGSLTSADFAPIPPGQAVPLTLALVGAGSVSASITPLYYRAW